MMLLNFEQANLVLTSSTLSLMLQGISDFEPNTAHTAKLNLQHLMLESVSGHQGGQLHSPLLYSIIQELRAIKSMSNLLQDQEVQEQL